MILGVPRELKSDEYRVALLPVGAELLVQDGHRVLLEAGAGEGSGFADEIYRAAPVHNRILVTIFPQQHRAVVADTPGLHAKLLVNRVQAFAEASRPAAGHSSNFTHIGDRVRGRHLTTNLFGAASVETSIDCLSTE